MKYFFMALIIVFLSSCQRRTNPPLSQDQKRFVQVYVQLLQVKERLTPQHPALLDSSKAILEKYHFTKEEYDKYTAYFNEKPERWEAFFKEALEQLKTGKNDTLRFQNTTNPTSSLSKSTKLQERASKSNDHHQ
ncbi:MAG: hypothetical protein ABIL68_13690 [bacterium]